MNKILCCLAILLILPSHIFAKIYLGTPIDELPILTGLSEKKDILTTLKKGQNVIKVYFEPAEKLMYMVIKERNNQYIQLNSAKISANFKKILSFSYLSFIKKPLYLVETKDGKEQLFIGDKASEVFDKIGEIASSEKDDFIAYQAAKENKAYMVFNDVLSNPYEAIGNVFVSDNGSYLYSAQENKTSILVHNGTALKDVENFALYSLSPKSADIFYTSSKDGKWFLFKNKEVISDGYDEILSLNISDDGKTYMITTKIGEEFFINYNGTLSPAYPKVFSAILTKDGTNYAYGVIKNKKGAYVINGIEGSYFDDLYGLNFSNSSSFAYWGQVEGKWTLFVNGEDKGKYSNILSPPTISKDGSTVCFWVEYQGKFILAVKDDEATRYYEKLLTFKFDANDNLYLIENQNKTLFYTLE